MLEKFLLEIEQFPGLGIPLAVLVAAIAFFLIAAAVLRLIRTAIRGTERWLAVSPRGMRVHRWFRERPETVLFVVGATCALVAAALLVKPARLLAEGEWAEGEVVSLAEAPRYDSSAKRNVTWVTATIRFAGRGRVMHLSRSWDRDGSLCIAGCYSRGERLKILYDPRDPEVAEVGTLFGLFGPTVIVGLVGCVFLVGWWGSRARRRASDPAISGPAVL
jgi:hypothetical protein